MRRLWFVCCLLLGCSGGHGGDSGVDGGADASICDVDPMPPGECRRDADCVSGQCVGDVTAAVDGAPIPLVCGVAGADAAGACALPTDCARGICLVSGACAMPCVQDADCAVDEVCLDAWASATADLVGSVRTCVPRAASPASVSFERHEPVDAAAGALSLSVLGGPALHVFTASGCLDLRATELSDASGASLFSDADHDASDPPLNPLSPLGLPLTLLVPSGSSAPSSSTPFSLGLAVEGAGALREFTLSGGEPSGELPVSLFYVGVDGYEPGADGSPPPEVSAALTELGRLLAVSVRVVEQRVVPGSVAARLAVLDEDPDGSSPERVELFSLSAGLDEPALPVFFVRAMDRGALGASGGIPGPMTLMGTGGSGVVVAAGVIGAERLSMGRVLAHEVGHFLGLFHPSELDGSGVEALADTPPCLPERDADGDGVLAASECAGFGADNLMFWSARAAGEALSPDQRAVLQRAPLLMR